MARRKGKRIKERLLRKREEGAELEFAPDKVDILDRRGLPLQENFPSTEQSERYYGILKNIYFMADDASYAGAYLELELSMARAEQSATTDDGSPIPEDFDYGDYQRLCGQLLRLRLVKEFTEAFELGTYLPEIMRASIDTMFKRPASTAEPRSHFFGTDEGYLLHALKQRVVGGRR